MSGLHSSRFANNVREVVGTRLLDAAASSPHVAYALDALALDRSELTVTVRAFTSMVGHLVAYVLDLDASATGVEVRDAWQPSDRPVEVSLQRSDGLLTFPGETISTRTVPGVDGPVVVRLREGPDDGWVLEVHSAARDRADAARWADDLVERARARDNPLRGCHLTATQRADQIHLVAEPYPTAARHELRFSDDVWDAVDASVHRHLRRAEDLRALGFGQRRGLLLHGPPGTGKTHLGRVIAAELAGKATTIVVDRAAMCEELHAVYAYAARLAPSVVFLEDVDVVANERSSGLSATLQALLNEMDGPLTPDAPVVTVATTNDLTALDDAAVRSGRFDQVVEVPTPDLEGRRLIVQRYAAALGDLADVDARRVAYATSDASGADLRELFRRALLDTDGVVTTDTLLRGLARPATGLDQGAYL